MSHARYSPARLLVVIPTALALAVALLIGYAVSPHTPRAHAATISAAKADAATDWAKSRRGSPYRYGADGPRRFDCSGLTRWAFARVGKWLPHSSSAQVSKTVRIAKENRRRGDLVFFYSRSGIYHVGIYAGRGYIWHASQPGVPVRKSKIWTSRVFYGRVK